MAAMELSLRRYVLLSLLVVVGVVIVAFTLMSANQFLAGMDGMLRGTMIDIARRTEVTPGQPVKVLNFTIAADWQDLPEDTQLTFSDNQIESFQLYKVVERTSIFHRPDEARFLLKAEFGGEAPVYIAQSFLPREPGNEPPFRITREAWILILGLSVLAGFTLLVLLMIRTVARPVEKLHGWAKDVGEQDEITPPPHFKYAELNTLASLFYNGMLSVKQSVKREQEFVRHASHELRTPIAVIRSSMELISRVRKGYEADKLTKPLQRIDNASHTMVDLTETLLWLTKVDKGELTTTDIEVSELIKKVTDELGYLLQGKDIALTIETQAQQINENATALRIVLGNLIRNAFQHTQHGSIAIEQQGDVVTITNQEYASDNELTNKDQELGFGLGLKMVSDLTAMLGWPYQHGRDENGRYAVVIQFNQR